MYSFKTFSLPCDTRENQGDYNVVLVIFFDVSICVHVCKCGHTHIHIIKMLAYLYFYIC